MIIQQILHSLLIVMLFYQKDTKNTGISKDENQEEEKCTVVSFV